MSEASHTTRAPAGARAQRAAAATQGVRHGSATQIWRVLFDRRLHIQLLRIALVGLVIAVWAFASGRWVDEFLVSNPQDVWSQIARWSTDGTFFREGRTTFVLTVEGFAIGAVGGIVLGYVLGWYRLVGEVLEPFVSAFYTIPKVALAPLFILWFGIGSSFKLAFAATIVFFPVFHNTFVGVREVPGDLIAAVRVMGGRRRDLSLRLVFPSALVWVVAGLKTSVPFALIGVVVGEMLVANTGLGYLIRNAANQFDTAGTFAAIVGVTVIGLVLDGLVTLSARRWLRWKDADAMYR